jgi:long-chain-fatty-acid--CoA ligase ACSBG
LYVKYLFVAIDSFEMSEFQFTDKTKNVKIQTDPNDPVASVASITIPQLLQRAVDHHGDHNALMYKDETTNIWKEISYKEYQHKVQKIAKAFIKLGLERQGVVAILACNSVEYVVAELAAIHAG